MRYRSLNNDQKAVEHNGVTISIKPCYTFMSAMEIALGEFIRMEASPHENKHYALQDGGSKVTFNWIKKGDVFHSDKWWEARVEYLKGRRKEIKSDLKVVEENLELARQYKGEK